MERVLRIHRFHKALTKPPALRYNQTHMTDIDFSTETKSQKFERLAGARAKRVLEDLRLLGNCGNGSNYEYRADQVFVMFKEIESEVARVRSMFNRPVPLKGVPVAQEAEN